MNVYCNDAKSHNGFLPIGNSTIVPLIASSWSPFLAYFEKLIAFQYLKKLIVCEIIDTIRKVMILASKLEAIACLTSIWNGKQVVWKFFRKTIHRYFEKAGGDF